MKVRSGKTTLPIEVADIDAMLEECPNLEDLREFMSEVPFDAVSRDRFRQELRERLWEILQAEGDSNTDAEDA